MRYYVSPNLDRASQVKPGQPDPQSPGYLLDADDRSQALRRVRAYLDGQHWATELGVKVVRGGTAKAA